MSEVPTYLLIHAWSESLSLEIERISNELPECERRIERVYVGPQHFITGPSQEELDDPDNYREEKKEPVVLGRLMLLLQEMRRAEEELQGE